MSKEYTIEDILIEIRDQFCEDAILDPYHVFLFGKIVELTNRMQELENELQT